MHQDQDMTDASCSTDECTSGKRNRFFRGKQMKAGEFRAEQAYFIKRRRLVNRAVLGWGVVYGFALEGPRKGRKEHEESRSRSIAVSGGFALDVHGRELLLTERVALTPENTFLLDTSGGSCCARPLESKDFHDGSAHYLLSVHYAEQHFGDVRLPWSCGCGKAQKNFTCETVLFSLRRLEKNSECPCAEGKCERKCDCHHAQLCKCGRGCHCLCQWVTESAPADEAAALCEWQKHWTDPSSGVGLACVQLQRVEPCKPLVFDWITDDCSPRRVVKNNELLYDLVRGCDLTRISKVSWGKWHRLETPVPWEAFERMFGPGPAEGSKIAYTELTVEFSGPVMANTVTVDCFALKVRFKSEDSGWHEMHHVRIAGLKLEPPQDSDPPGTTRAVRIGVSPRWYREVTTNASKFQDEETTVQIEIYGDLILDCHGQAIDANARGFALSQEKDSSVPEPSGNGSPGGTFVSVFRVGVAPEN